MMFTKYLRWTVFTAVFAALFTPFIVSQDLFFPFIVGKAIFFRSCVEIAFAAWILLTLRDASARPKLSAIFYSFLAFVAIIGLADVFGMNLWKSFWSNFERMEGFVTILHLLAYFIVAGSVLTSEKIWKYFLQTSLAASAIVSLYGLLQFFGEVAVNQSGTRLDSFLGNATYLAIYLVFNIFFALILAMRDRNPVARSIYGAVIFLHMVIMYNTGTRGTVLGLLAGLFVTAIIIAIFDKGERRRRIVAISFMGVIVAIVLGFLMIKNTQFVKESPVLSRFAAISASDDQIGARSYIWPMAIKGFEQKPILGWGQENFNYVFNANYDPRMYGQEQWFDRAHNVILDWLVNGGALGLLAYLSLWVSALYLLWKKASDTSLTEKALITGLGVAYFVNNLFVFDNIVSYMLFAAVLAFIHFKSTRLTHPVGAEVEEIETNDMNLLTGLVLVALGVCMYFVNIQAYGTGASLINALRATSVVPVQADAAIAAFTKALSYNSVGRGEVVERLIEAVPRMNTNDVSLDLRQKYYTLASDSIEKQLARLPGDARYELFSGSFYALYSMNDVALKHFLTSVSLSPNKQTILFSLGSLYIGMKKYDEGLATFKKAYELDESNTLALQYYAVALVSAGRESEASAFLKQKTGISDMTSDTFVQSYVNLGNWPKVISILMARIQAEPNNLEIRKSLAGAYLQIGNKAAAIKVLQDIAKVDPTLKTAIDEYIRQIQAASI